MYIYNVFFHVFYVCKKVIVKGRCPPLTNDQVHCHQQITKATATAADPFLLQTLVNTIIPFNVFFGLNYKFEICISFYKFNIFCKMLSSEFWKHESKCAIASFQRPSVPYIVNIHTKFKIHAFYVYLSVK